MSTTTETDESAAIIAAAMALAARRGWRTLTMADIAAEAQLSLGEVYRHYRTKAEILNGLSRHADAAVLGDVLNDPGEESPRDRLFDAIMRRFDALSPFKAGIAALLRELPDAASGFAVLHQLSNSMRWMLEAASIDTSGIRGSIQVAGLAAIYANVMRTWLRDDTLDAARTMSELDRQLRWAEQIMNSFGHRRGSRSAGASGSATAPAGPLDPSI